MIYLLESCFAIYYYVNNCKYFYLSSFLSHDTVLPLLNVKRNLLIFIELQDRDVFFVFKVVNIVKFGAIIGPRPTINDKFIKLNNSIGISCKRRPITLLR